MNALGEPTPGGQLTSTPPDPGDNLKLTINPAVQEAGEAALAERGLPGAFVSMNIHTGEILGIGSSPTYDPTVWTKPMPARSTKNSPPKKPATRSSTGRPPRPTRRARPTRSSPRWRGWKTGSSRPSTVVDDTGSIEVGGQKFENSEGEVNGPISLVRALEVSSDVFFYTQGYKMWKTNDLQEWSAKMGIGRPTGIDLPLGEGAEGLVPSKKWTEEEDRRTATNSSNPGGRARTSSWRSARATCRPIPLEMAIAYAALGNGGTIVTPHLGMEVQDAARAGRCGKSTRARGAT